MKIYLKVTRVSFTFLLAFGCINSPQKDKSNVEYAQLDTLATLYHRGKLKDLISKAKQFTNTYPLNDKGWHLLSSAYLSVGEDSLSELCAQKALAINPNNHVALTNMGILFDKKKKYKKAEEYYLRAIKSNPNIAQIYSNYAANRLYSGDYDLAVKYGEKAVEMAGNIKDKAILCLSYHKAGMFAKRDSLYTELKRLGYENIDKINEIFKKDKTD